MAKRAFLLYVNVLSPESFSQFTRLYLFIPLPSPQSSPPSFCAQYRTPDLEALLHVIESAQTNISIAVMDYAPAFVYRNPPV